MSIYYVSANGCDCNDGLSPETAWKTISKVNSSVVGGDEIRFHCGDTFYGLIRPPKGIDADHPTTYTSYGTGPKPLISEFKIVKPCADVWEKVSDNVYKLDISDTSRYDGNVTEINGNAGYLLISGKIYPRKMWNLEDLELQWDFYTDNNDNNVLYVYSEKNPAELSDDIRIACRINGMVFANDLKVCGLSFTGIGAHGISGVGRRAYVYDCEFHNIGGSRLDGYGKNTTRYGNGVECWAGSSDITVDHCKFSGVYDVAMTMQGPCEEDVRWENMHFTNNIVWDSTQAFEIWSRGTHPNTGFRDCWFENNICINAGRCWAYDVRPDKAVSAHLLLYGLECPLCDITVRGNTFINSRVNTLFKSGGFTQIPAGYKIIGNTVLRPAGQEFAWRDKCTDEECAAFEAKIAADNCVMDTETY